MALHRARLGKQNCVHAMMSTCDPLISRGVSRTGSGFCAAFFAAATSGGGSFGGVGLMFAGGVLAEWLTDETFMARPVSG